MLRIARNHAGISREEASFRLHIGCRTLADYEAGKTTAPPDVVLKMAEVYKQPTLTARYCSEICPIGQVYANPVETKDLATAVLGLVKEYNDVRSIRDRLIELASDGIISKDEIPEFITVLDELMDLEQKIETLKLFAARFVAVDRLVQERKRKSCLAMAAR